ncbi:YdcF family protein [Tsukamurella serpentis]
MNVTPAPVTRPQGGRHWPRRLLWSAVIVAVVALACVGGGGYLLFGGTQSDPLRKVDAIIVLGGEHDGREQYGITLAEAGYASTVVLSNPYGSRDHVMSGLCDRTQNGVTVRCETPEPSTTRGEAMITERLSERFGWRSVIVISWSYHLTRARYIYSNCFSGQTVMQAVPRKYEYGPADWTLIYLYQFTGTLKAVLQGPCG